MKNCQPALIYLLKAFLPYTRQNILVTFKPRQFFTELARQSHYTEMTIRSTLYRAHRSSYITSVTSPILTELGYQKLRPFITKKLKNHGRLMVIFDIPETMRMQRRQLRNILRILKFIPAQKSVWISDYDHYEYIRDIITQLRLEAYVQLYEAALIEKLS